MSVTDLSVKIVGSLGVAVLLAAGTLVLSDSLIYPKNIGTTAYPLSTVLENQTVTASASTGGGGKGMAAPASTKPAPLGEDVLAKADADAGRKIAQRCMVCHTFNKGEPAKVGPNLWGIIDNKRAHMAGFNYSDTIAHLGGFWTVQNIAAFIYKPKAYAPGTKMGFGGLPAPQDRANVLAFLNRESDKPVDLVKEGAVKK